MARSSIDVAKTAVALWRGNHGDESLDQQCQRFDGYYWQWAWAGTERGIVTYDTATAAADASRMYSTRINESGVQPGDLANWYWNPAGHVGTVVGKDGNGRVLVAHTSSKGDTLLTLGNNVKVSHADTIGLTFRGYSRTNGANAQRTGLTAWPIPEPASSDNNDPDLGQKEDEEMNPKVVARRENNKDTEWSLISPEFGQDLAPGESRPDGDVTVFLGRLVTTSKSVGDAWGRMYCRAYLNVPIRLDRTNYIAAQKAGEVIALQSNLNVKGA